MDYNIGETLVVIRLSRDLLKELKKDLEHTKECFTAVLSQLGEAIISIRTGSNHSNATRVRDNLLSLSFL